jgi:uncharacterized protein
MTQLARFQHPTFGSPRPLDFLRQHPVLTYYALVFAISWGLILIVLGPRGFSGTGQTIVLAAPSILAGPAIAGLLMTAFVGGRAGLRELLSRLLRWRVGARWYAVALLPAPLLTMVILFALSRFSPEFIPAIVTADDKAGLLLTGIVVGLVGPFCEELGWTGFATPRLRLQHGVLATGLIMGLLWGAWHFPLFMGDALSSQAVPPPLYLGVLLFSWLPPYRVLMVWVHDRTRSLLVAMLMHLPIVFDSFVFATTPGASVAVVVHVLVFAAALWTVVAAIALASRGQLAQPPLQGRDGHPGGMRRHAV